MSSAFVIEDAYPLTRMQSGMLYHSQVDAGSSTYHDLSSVRISGPCDSEALRQVLAELVAGHETLRSALDVTRFSEPMQLVHAAAPAEVSAQDLRGLAEPERTAAVERWRAEEKVRGFELAVPPLLRIHLQRLTDDEFWLNVSFHHAILDGWSLSLFISRLLGGYDRLLAGCVPERTRLETQIRDFVRLERETLGNAAAKAYWHELVADTEPTGLARWLDSGRTPERSARRRQVPLPADATGQVRAVAAAARVSQKAVLYGAHAAVLSRLTGQERVVTGQIVNCRPETSDADRMLGVFLNTLPMVMSTRDATWIDLARQAHAAEIDALEFRRYPLSQIVADSGRESLFETLVDYRNMRSYAAIPLEHIAVGRVDFFEQTNFPFAAQYGADPQSGEIQLRLSYDAAEFSDCQIEAIGECYIAAFEAMGADPEALVSSAALLGASEHNRVINLWNDTADDLPIGQTLPQLLAAAAQAYPDRVAVRFGSQELTHRELDQRANALAHRLRGHGIGADAVVGVHLERSLALVVALVAVLKAGGAYLPLEPDVPFRRLRAMLDGSAAKAVINDPALAERLGSATCIELTMDDGLAETAPDVSIDPDNLAYTLYTSGSTGDPKGVQVTHRAVVNRLSGMQRVYGLTSDDRVLHKTPIGFDVSVWELFWPLTAGAGVVVAAPGRHREPGYLVNLITDERITLCHFVPTMLSAFIHAPGVGELSSLRHVLSGAEALSPDLAQRAQRILPGRLHHLYGPTEATIDVTAWPCPEADELDHVAIGAPVQNTQVYVLDDLLRPSPVGGVGELYLGGVQLARGYLGRPDQTAERFVADPYGVAGGRLYRTGDRARWLADGTLQFVGRLDQQVKIRGYRVELGEVEAVLARHAGVSRAAAVVRADGAGGQRLLAFLTVRASPEPTIAELRDHVALHLPDYMVPAAFVILDNLPLTPSGKVDRNALPDAGRKDTDVEGFVEPANPTEKLISEMWAQELSLDAVGVTDDFRDLGGHSIAALRLVLRIRAATDVDIPIATLIIGGTVRRLAEIVDGERGCVPSNLVPLHEVTGRPPIYFVHPHGGGVFGYAELANSFPDDQPVYGVQAFDFADPDGPRPDTVEEIAKLYGRAIRRMQPHGPYYIGGWCMGGMVAYEMARRFQIDGEQVGMLAICSESFNTTLAGGWGEDEAAAALGVFGDGLPTTAAELRAIDPAERLNHVFKLAQSRERRRWDVGSVEDLRALAQIYLRHARALKKYRAQDLAPYRGDAVLIRAEIERHGAGDMGWGPRIDGRLTVIESPGDHWSMLRKQNAPALAERLAVAAREGLDGLDRFRDPRTANS